MTEQAKNIHQRLAEVMKVVTYIQKEAKQGMRYKIVSHDKVTAKVRPALLEAGIVYYPVRCEHQHNGNRAECGMTIRFVNVDAPEDFFDVQTFGYGVDDQDKGPGKAMSYAVKYALLKALGLETGDDADHDSVDHNRTDPAIYAAAVTAALRMIESETTLEGLGEYWADLAKNQKAVSYDAKVIAAKDKRKGELSQKEAGPDEGDQIAADAA